LRFFQRTLWILTLLTLLAGCANSQPQIQPPQDGQQGKAISYPLTIVDSMGTTVTIEDKPQRIVSLLPSSTEILCALGQVPIAVTQWDNYPVDIQEKAEYIFQDGLNPDMEELLNLNPDLIVFYQTLPEKLNKVRELGIPVIVFDSKSINETYDVINKMGQITDTQEQAAQLINDMKLKEKAIEEKLSTLSEQEKHKVWLEVDSQLYTAGSGTFLNEMITKAGGINIAEDIQGWGQFNNEQIISRNPDTILVTYGSWDASAVENIKKRKGWESIQAVKNDRIIEIDNDIVSRQGPRIIDGLTLMAKAMYPERF